MPVYAAVAKEQVFTQLCACNERQTSTNPDSKPLNSDLWETCSPTHHRKLSCKTPVFNPGTEKPAMLNADLERDSGRCSSVWRQLQDICRRLELTSSLTFSF